MDHVFKRAPMQHQREVFEKSKDSAYYGVLWDPGLGKTLLAINNAVYLWNHNKIDSLVVVAPKGLYINWRDELLGVPGYQEGDFPDDIAREMFIWSGDAGAAEARRLATALRPPTTGTMHILLFNVEAASSKRGQEFLETFLLNHTPILVIDESTVIKHYDSARSKFLIRVGRFAPYRRILTGSFTDNSPFDSYGQLDFLSPAILGYCSWVVFRARYGVLRKAIRAGFTKEDVDKGRKGATFMELTGYRNLDDLRARMLPHCSIIKKEDALDLPAKVYETHYVAMSAKQSALYQQMRLESIATIERQLAEKATARQPKPLSDAEMQAFIDSVKAGAPIALAPSQEALDIFDPSTSSTARIVLSQLMRLHQIACGFIKTDDGVEHPVDDVNPSVQDLLDKLGQMPGKVVIWCTYRHTIKELVDAIGQRFGPETVAHYYGDTTTEERNEVRAEFRNAAASVRFVVANPASAGRGITLLDPTADIDAQYMIFFSNDFDYERRRQAEDRFHRKGQHKSCVIIDFIRAGTVDVKILQAHRTKQDLNKAITTSNWRQCFE